MAAPEFEYDGDNVVIRFIATDVVAASPFVTRLALRIATNAVPEIIDESTVEYKRPGAGGPTMAARVTITGGEDGGSKIAIDQRFWISKDEWERATPAQVAVLAGTTQGMMSKWLQAITTSATQIETTGGVTATASTEIKLLGSLPELQVKLRTQLGLEPHGRGLPGVVLKVEDRDYGAFVVECVLVAEGKSVTSMTLTTRCEIPLANPAVDQQPALQRQLVAAITGRAAALRTAIGADFPQLGF